MRMKAPTASPPVAATEARWYTAPDAVAFASTARPCTDSREQLGHRSDGRGEPAGAGTAVSQGKVTLPDSDTQGRGSAEILEGFPGRLRARSAEVSVVLIVYPRQVVSNVWITDGDRDVSLSAEGD